MSRFKRFAHSLVSGYALIVANVCYTLASVPLALHYLTKEEFGLWAVVSQVCNFNMLVVDLGMSGAVARILIDHKDDRTSTKYGEVIQTGLLVLLVQGMILAVVGGLLSYWLPQWMAVGENYWPIFRQLVIWQCLLLAISYVLRIFSFILQAHQRFDVCNYSNLAGFAAGLLGLWLGFAAGWGLYAMLLGAGMTIVFYSGITLWQTWRLRLFPGRNRWGKPNFSTFKELFFYGTDLFLVMLGLQLITACQAPIITRTLGLEATAVWSIATKLFMLSQQVVYRILDYSLAAFSEMMVRGEKERLKIRFRELVILSGAVSIGIAATMALCNRAFLALWTQGRISWPAENDLLMALSLAVYAGTRCHIGLACITKRVESLKYIYFVEGICFVGLGLLLAPRVGLTGVILAGIVTNLIFAGCYGVRRSARYFALPASEILCQWLRGPLVMGLFMAVAAGAIWYLTESLTHLPQLIVRVLLAVPIALLCLWKFGVPTGLQSELRDKLLRKWRAVSGKTVG
jgi:O-antigen/teichoic acid export membrane protein